MLIRLTIAIGLLIGSGVSFALENADDKNKDFVWYCESDEATEAQKTTVKEILEINSIDPTQVDCKSAYEKLTTLKRTFLYFENEPIEDLKPLTGLDYIDEILCSVCSFAAIESIPPLPNLDILSLSANGFEEVPDVTRFPKLTTLSLFEPLSKGVDPERIKNVQILDLGSQKIPDLHFVAEMPNLVGLHLLEIDPKLLESIPELPAITEATFYDMYRPPHKFEFLKKFPNLRSLNLVDNYLESLDGIYLNPNLKRLFLNSNQITTISKSQLPVGLEELYLDENPIKNYGFLSELKNLRVLSVIHNSFTDWGAFNSFQATIERLHLQNTNIKERPRTSGEKLSWPNLTAISIGGTQIKSLAFFKDFDMPKLNTFGGPDIENKTEENCPTAGVPEHVAHFCKFP